MNNVCERLAGSKGDPPCPAGELGTPPAMGAPPARDEWGTGRSGCSQGPDGEISKVEAGSMTPLEEEHRKGPQNALDRLERSSHPANCKGP